MLYAQQPRILLLKIITLILLIIETSVISITGYCLLVFHYNWVKPKYYPNMTGYVMLGCLIYYAFFAIWTYRKTKSMKEVHQWGYLGFAAVGFTLINNCSVFSISVYIPILDIITLSLASLFAIFSFLSPEATNNKTLIDR